MMNNQIFNNILNTLLIKISRRTNEQNAVKILNTVMKDLSSQYSFLSLITIQNTLYKEGANNIIIKNTDIFNKINLNDINNCIKDIFKLTIKLLERDADYFFIKEFNDAISYIDDIEINEKSIDFNLLQFKYILDRRQSLKIKNSNLLKIIINASISVIKELSKTNETYTIIKPTLISSFKKYKFLEEIDIIKNPDSQKSYSININSSIDVIPSYQISKVIYEIILQVGYKIPIENQSSYIQSLQNNLNDVDILSLKKIGVNLNQINLSLSNIKFNDIISKILSIFIELLCKKYQKEDSILYVNNIIKNLSEKHQFLNNVIFNNNLEETNQNYFKINSEINIIDPHNFSKALEEIIGLTVHNIKDDQVNLFNDFKNKLGKEYLNEIEKIGVNLNLVEMKFLINT